MNIFSNIKIITLIFYKHLLIIEVNDIFYKTILSFFLQKKNNYLTKLFKKKDV